MRIQATIASAGTLKERTERMAVEDGPDTERPTGTVLRLPSGAQEPGTVFLNCDACPSMIVVPSGSFTMGSPQHEVGTYTSERPVRHVAIAEPFAVGIFEVTPDEFWRYRHRPRAGQEPSLTGTEARSKSHASIPGVRTRGRWPEGSSSSSTVWKLNNIGNNELIGTRKTLALRCGDGHGANEEISRPQAASSVTTSS